MTVTMQSGKRTSAVLRLVSPQAGARILGISTEQIVVAMAERRIPVHRVGKLYRLATKDIADYARRERERRHKGLDELASETEQLGLYE